MSLPLRSLSRHLTGLVSGGSQLGRSAPQWARAFSTAPAAAEDDDEDIVLEVFKQQQHSFRVMMDGMRDINVPLDGNEAGVKQYVKDMEALKRKAGMPEVDEVVHATLEYKAKCSRGNIRRFIADATEGIPMGDYADTVQDILGAVDEVEEAQGKLEPENRAGWEAFQGKVKAIQKKYGLDDPEKVKQSFLLQMYTKQLADARVAAQDTMDAIKRKEGFEGLEVDAGTLKPAF